MDAGRLREIRAAGVTVGSHTANHAKLAEVPPEIKREELASSKAALEDVLGEEVRHLCYPFGSFDLDTVHAARETGYTSAATCLRGAATPEDHPLVLPRKAISFGDNLIGYGWKVLFKHAPVPALAEWRRRMGREASG
jgi:peptidoglycan/xylan/chitin deacetylase (PgdA/CDA1 family)